MSLLNDIAHACGQLQAVIDCQNWKAKPAIEFQFETINEFAAAKFRLEKEMTAMLWGRPVSAKVIHPHIIEFRYMDIPVRLICHERIMTVHGLYGAAELDFTEIKIPDGPPDTLD